VNDPPSLSHADHRPFEEYEAILDAPNVASAFALPQSAGDQHKDHIRESTDPRAPTIDEPARRSPDKGDAGVTKLAFISSCWCYRNVSNVSSLFEGRAIHMLSLLASCASV
jgi:hypothetical protein